jgi:hypothetical protein
MVHQPRQRLQQGVRISRAARRVKCRQVQPPARRFGQPSAGGDGPKSSRSTSDAVPDAIASHLRIGDPVFTHLLFGVYVGFVGWAVCCCAGVIMARKIFVNLPVKDLKNQQAQK